MNGQYQLPQRSCCACRGKFDKSELIRVVRRPEREGGDIILDRTGRTNGRGVYICPNADCLKLARKKRGLERGLRGQVPDEVYVALEEELGGGKK
ncbi:MAG: YlxR family protein [Oscillospiraceae bacterium]|nr:YlxR family protein [Oscillospiraceae bacterium]